MKTPLRLAAALLVTSVTLGCGDVPLLPQWTVQLYAPIGGSNLNGFVSGTPIPPGASVATPSAVRSVPMDGVTGDALDKALELTAPAIAFQFTVTKSASLQVSLADTLFLASDSASLATSTIASGFAMPAGATTITDTLALGPTAISLLQQLVAADGTLWLQVRGRASYPGSSPYVVQPTDSVHVKVALLIKVPVAGGK